MFFGILIYIFLLFFNIKRLISIYFLNSKVIEFDYNLGVHSDFLEPLYTFLTENRTNEICLCTIQSINSKWIYNKKFKIRHFFPPIYSRLIKRKVIVTASDYSGNFIRDEKIRRILTFHGITSLGPVAKLENLLNFDKVFLNLTFMERQIIERHNELKNVPIKFIKIGYPKIDKFVRNEISNNVSITHNAVFYGPTYHIEVSSIFYFLDEIIKFALDSKKKLYIKLHPFLLFKDNYDYCGNLDWEKIILNIEKINQNIIFVRNSMEYSEIVDIFNKVDYFITDTSGLGYEFMMITKKPIVFLGKKLKMPVEDLKLRKYEKYKSNVEVMLRGKVGPIIETPNNFNESIVKFEESYNTYFPIIENVIDEHFYNVGTATQKAVNEILKSLDEIK